MRVPSALAVLCFGLTSLFVQAQDCANGQCFKLPGQPLRRTANFVADTVQTVREVQPLRSVLRVQTFGGDQCGYSVGSTVSGGCTGSLVVRSYSSTGGGSSGGFGRDTDGALITSVGVAVPLAPRSEVDSLGFKQRKSSRQAIVDACQEAHVQGTITASQLQAIKLATRSPRMLQRMEDLIVERAQSSGAYAFTLDSHGDVVMSAINWEAIGDFIIKIAPIIFKLIELFL